MPDSVQKLEQRQDKFERELGSVIGAVGDLTQTVTTINANVRHIDANMTGMFKRLDEVRTQKPPWMLVMGLITLVITIWGMSMVPTHFRVTKVEEAAEKLNDRVIRQAELNGYQKAQLEILREKE